MWKVVIEFEKQPVDGCRKFILNWYKTKKEAQLIADVHNKIYPTACHAYVEKK